MFKRCRDNLEFLSEAKHCDRLECTRQGESCNWKISGQSNLLLHNISILNDPDIVDTPIDDRDINVSFENPGDENITHLTLDSLNVNSMQNNSSVFLGKGHVTGMDANQKGNTSQGNLNGNSNQLLNNININNDQDVVDAMIDDRDLKQQT